VQYDCMYIHGESDILFQVNEFLNLK
jgi:hypothetical protein